MKLLILGWGSLEQCTSVYCSWEWLLDLSLGGQRGRRVCGTSQAQTLLLWRERCHGQTVLASGGICCTRQVRLGRGDPLWLLESEGIKMRRGRAGRVGRVCGSGAGCLPSIIRPVRDSRRRGAGGKGEERTGDERAETRFEDTGGRS